MKRILVPALAALAAFALEGCQPAGPTGETFSCGADADCAQGQICREGVCHDPTDACTPKTCATLGRVCGQQPDGCGHPLACACGVAVACDADQRCTCATAGWTVGQLDSRAMGPTSLALGADGSLHAVYTQAESGLTYAHFAAGQPDWAPIFEPVDRDSGVQSASIAVDGSGTVHIVYYRATEPGTTAPPLELWHARRAPGETTWTLSLLADAGLSYQVYGVDTGIAVDAAGVVHVAYFVSTFANADVWVATLQADGRWAREQVTTGARVDADAAAGDLSLGAGPDGTLHLAFYDYVAHTLRYAHHAVAGTWKVEAAPVAALTPGDASEGIFSSLAVDGEGVVHVGYARIIDRTHGEFWYARLVPGAGWVTERVDRTPDAVGSSPSVAVAPDGTVYAVFQNWTHPQLRFAMRTGSGWTGIAVVDNQGNVGSSTAMVLDRFGVLHVSYIEQLGAYSYAAKYAHRCL